ncbi:MAG: methyltransferase domain-containing protein [Alphaproteobacteria bacterium]|nr:methyltransferase domain-containing protein [Alphaproteobacteria bacterium]
MATQREIDFTYGLVDKIFRLSMGESGDFSGAKYDGDFSLTLEEAQRRKHNFIFEQLNLQPGQRVLDMGCGWGPALRYLKGRGVEAVGVTLSKAQAAACRRNGLEAHVMDCREITPDTFGSFDAVVSLGAFEHFCSREQFDAGRQDAVYHDLFRVVQDLIPTGGRFFLQTMVFGPKMIDPEEISIDAEAGSIEHALALMVKQFPGSWLPYGSEQIESNAAPYFQLISKSSGRLDYIETIGQWRKRFNEPSLKKSLFKLSLVPRYLFDRNFRQAFATRVSYNRICFETLAMDHFRMVFARD